MKSMVTHASWSLNLALVLALGFLSRGDKITRFDIEIEYVQTIESDWRVRLDVIAVTEEDLAQVLERISVDDYFSPADERTRKRFEDWRLANTDFDRDDPRRIRTYSHTDEAANELWDRATESRKTHLAILADIPGIPDAEGYFDQRRKKISLIRKEWTKDMNWRSNTKTIKIRVHSGGIEILGATQPVPTEPQPEREPAASKKAEPAQQSQ